MDYGPADGGQPSGPSDVVPGRWQQRAGFSVFFDAQTTVPSGSGELRQRTRLYHEETGNETTLRGWEPTDWVRWILDRLGSAQPPSAPTGATASLVSMEIVDVRLVGDPEPRSEVVQDRGSPQGPSPHTGDDTVAVELQLRVTGMAELRQTLRATVVGVLFGPYPQ
jgi:hypothetical protein